MEWYLTSKASSFFVFPGFSVKRMAAKIAEAWKHLEWCFFHQQHKTFWHCTWNKEHNLFVLTRKSVSDVEVAVYWADRKIWLHNGKNVIFICSITVYCCLYLVEPNPWLCIIYTLCISTVAYTVCTVGPCSVSCCSQQIQASWAFKQANKHINWVV